MSGVHLKNAPHRRCGLLNPSQNWAYQEENPLSENFKKQEHNDGFSHSI